jgi:uncharacterized protein YjbJ (UPF0337 family)
MNKEQIGEKVDEVKGRVEQSVYEAVDDQVLANERAGDRVKGAAKETWDSVKEAAAAAAKQHHREAKRHANKARANVPGRPIDTVIPRSGG